MYRDRGVRKERERETAREMEEERERGRQTGREEILRSQPFSSVCLSFTLNECQMLR